MIPEGANLIVNSYGDFEGEIRNSTATSFHIQTSLVTLQHRI